MLHLPCPKGHSCPTCTPGLLTPGRDPREGPGQRSRRQGQGHLHAPSPQHAGGATPDSCSPVQALTNSGEPRASPLPVPAARGPSRPSPSRMPSAHRAGLLGSVSQLSVLPSVTSQKNTWNLSPCLRWPSEQPRGWATRIGHQDPAANHSGGQSQRVKQEATRGSRQSGCPSVQPQQSTCWPLLLSLSRVPL